MSVHVGFVVDRLALGQVFSGFSLVSVIIPWLSIPIYHLGDERRPLGGFSSEISSHPININKKKTDIFFQE
jgi:hypothetical protein